MWDRAPPSPPFLPCLFTSPSFARFLSHYAVLWGIHNILCLFCFVRLRIYQQRKKIGAWNFAGALVYYLERSSPILEVRSQSRQGQKMCLALPRPTRLTYEWYALAASGRLQQRASAADERISWRPSGDGMQWCSLGIRNYAWGSAGIRNWGRRHWLRPYGGICVLQACWRTCLLFHFSFSYSLYLFSYFVHPFSFYSTGIVPLHFQVWGCRKRPNLGFNLFCWLCVICIS